MEQYIVSARKYRPTTFDSVVGQQSLTDTLRNAIRTNHLAHAYLFCGPRGVGKATCARIFAKTINCLNPTADHEACNECESCRAFNEQRSYNIHELDAASNNSVEDIRTLIQEVRIPPQMGKYKVYIIDEVHMLSAGAFNALLKTLEEPPSYAIFILATTEKHKVLPTILSRCQVYDFQRIGITDIVGHLQHVALKEGIQAEEQALAMVAKKADGGMRDALSVFDQLVAFCGQHITYKQTIDVLNILDTDYYFRMVNASLHANVSEALLLFDEVLHKGFDAGTFVNGLESHLRDVLVSKDEQTLPLLETADSVREQYKEQAQACPAVWLFKSMDLLNQCDIQYRTSTNKRLSVELALIKWCAMNDQAMQTASAASAPALPKTAAVAQPAKAQPKAQPSAPSRLQNMPAIPSINIPAGAAPFTTDQFNDAWIGLKGLFPREERLQAILSTCQPTLTDNHVVLIVANRWQKEEFDRFRQDLTATLRQSLANDEIEIDVRIDDTPKEKIAYTAEEKLQRMLKEHSELQDFRDTLGLMLD